jgi:hypothetical protein
MHGVASGLPARIDLSGYRFVDLNGDHKDDLLWVTQNGQVNTWINQRGYSLGLTPDWAYMGQTHAGFGSPSNVTFANLRGSGRGDYIIQYVGFTYLSTPVLGYGIYANLDSGGTQVRSDGDRYCDMRGTGADDYIWISSTGEITLYGNYHTPPYWLQFGVIFNVNWDRNYVRIHQEFFPFAFSHVFSSIHLSCIDSRLHTCYCF